MAIKFLQSVEVDGEVQGTSLDINGNADISGNLGVGTDSPNRQFEVRNASGVGYGLISGTTGAELRFRPTNSYTNNGNFGIEVTGTNSGNYTTTMNITGYHGGETTILTLKGNKDVYMQAGAALYMDGGGDTYIQESAANNLLFATNGSSALALDSSQNATFAGTLASGAITTTGTITLPSSNTLTGSSGKVAFNGRVSGSTPTGTTDFTTKAYVDLQISNLIDSAPGTLDTLNELAEALNDDDDAIVTLTNSITANTNNITTNNTIANAALPKAGGTMTGSITLDDSSGASPSVVFKNESNNNGGISINSSGKIEIQTGGTVRQTISGSETDFAGEVKATSLDINGNADISGNLTGVDGLTMSGNLTTGNGSIECGDLDVSGTITGDGSSIDSINAGNIASGTLAVGRGGTGLTSISTLLNSNVTSVSGSSGSCTGNAATATTAGTVTTAAQSSITSLGTLTGLVISGAISSSNTTQSTNKSSGAFKTSGGVGIAKTLNVGEDVVAYASSDKRYKDNLQAITNPIDKVKSLTGYTFTWNDKHEQFNGNNDIGVVAQEVEKVFPEIVDTRDNGYKAVKYEKMVAVLIEAVKDQQKQIDELKAIVDGNSK